MPHGFDSAIKRPVRAFLEPLQSHRRHLALVPSERQNLEVHKARGVYGKPVPIRNSEQDYEPGNGTAY